MAAAALHAFLLSLGLILPLGVQNLFVFNQGALHRRFRCSLPIVVTASICDTLLITAAVTGVSVLLLAWPAVARLLLAAGALFLLYMGAVIWRSTPKRDGGEQEAFPAGKQIAFGLFVSLLNPHALLDTVGVIGTNSLVYHGWDKAVFGACCVSVSWLWFFGLAFAGKIAGTLDQSGRFMKRLNRVSAVVMWTSAFWMTLRLR